MKHYLLDTQEVLKELSVDSGVGLSTTDAENKLAKNGKNKLDEPPKKSFMARVAQQLMDPMILILLAAAGVSFVTAIYEGESFADVLIILFVVILNSVLGVLQESKAEKAIEALKAISAQVSKVLRDGTVKQIKSEDLTVGDIILIEAGDSIPADARIIESASLKVEESALTGESVPVEKHSEALAEADGNISLGDRTNMLYMGSAVVYGRGKAVVTATGMSTEMGKIADQINTAADGRTPLQQKLDGLGKLLTKAVLGICVFIFLFNIVKAGTLNLDLAISTFMLAVSLAVAAIPEGLAAVVTIVLSIGVTKMSKRSAVIRKLTAVETLGCTNVICSDKTGTLTQNKMTVVDTFTDNKAELIQGLCLCCDATLDTEGKVIGEPTEAALVAFARDESKPKYELEKALPRVAELPFDSSRKLMTTIHRSDTELIQYTKGAPDMLLGRCTMYLKGEEVLPLDDTVRAELARQNKGFADKALRVLACAKNTLAALPDKLDSATLENNLIFIGLVGMIDPVRPEAVQAIANAKGAGIRTVMITGDHKDTAAAIARELNILDNPSQAITGAELDSISDEDLASTIQNYSVYARVQPDHKVRIVKAWRSRGMVTAMTGDGVNDAPAIKSADIGIGMGITGTDVTKNVADMVLGDDNFATIVSAVKEGRRIYDNIRRTIQFLLSSNLSEVLLIFFATLMGFTILLPVHLLWINLITDMLPALALGVENAESDIMSRPPRGSSEGIFSGGVGKNIIYGSIAVMLLTFASYFIGVYHETGSFAMVTNSNAITMAFLTLSMSEIFHSFNLRSINGSIFNLKTHNRLLYLSMFMSMILTAAVIYIQPLAKMFEFSHIDLTEYLISLALSISIIPIIEIIKLIERRRARA